MDSTPELWVGLLVPILLLSLGGVLGRLAERRHQRQMSRREDALAHIRLNDLDRLPADAAAGSSAALVVAEAVVASDYLKTFLAALRNFVGGEVRSFATLLARARREAFLRLIEQAHGLGHDAVCNVRLTTAQIGRTMVAVQASGTAYTRGASGEG